MRSRLLRRLAVVTAAAAASSVALVAVGLPASAALVDDPIESSAPDAALALAPIGSFETGVFDEGAAEIVEPYGDRLFVVNAQAASVSVLDYSDPTAIVELFAIVGEGVANSVAVRADGLGVIALESTEKTDPGSLVFFDADAPDAASAVLGSVTVGALPDMVTISADGRWAVVANEAEPSDDFTLDPEGSIGVVELPSTKTAPEPDAVRLAGFEAFEGGVLDPAVRVFGPDVPAPDQGDEPLSANRVSRNLEPEYIAVDGAIAYVTVQEANALAVVDLESATVLDVVPLGSKDHALPGFGLDPSDRDGPAIDIRTFAGLRGLYMPDGIASYQAGAQTYLVTANEGDVREWGDYSEAARAADLGADGLPPVCDDSIVASQLADDQLGRLNVATASGLDETGTCYTQLYAFGSRSFSIWTTGGAQVFDSGEDFEQVTAEAVPDFFNSTSTESTFDTRSDDKGPEPENVVVGEVSGRTYAFVGLERIGGVMVYDITDPGASRFVTYVNNRDFSASPEEDLAAAGDLGPEGLAFIGAAASPTGEPLVAVANEVSGTTTLYSITVAPQAQPVAPGNPGTVPVLPATGGEPSWAALGAAVLLLVGGAVVVAARRRAKAV